MDKLSQLSRGMQIMLAAGVLLLIDTFFRWQEVSGSIAGVEFSSGANAWHGFWGVVMGLLTIVLLAWVIARIAAVDIPIPVSTAMVSATVAIVIFLFALIKNLADDYSTFWSYPMMSFTDSGLPPGSYTYTIKVSDPFGNTLTLPATTAVNATLVAKNTYVSDVLKDGASDFWRLGDPGTTAADSAGSDTVTMNPGVTRGTAGAIVGDNNVASIFAQLLHGNSLA